MERVLTTEEKIRRAEEIYARRNRENYKNTTATVNVAEKKDIKLFKKMIIQIIISLLIYTIFYFIQNANYVFSDNILNSTREILAYDIDFENLYRQVVGFFNENNIKETDIQDSQNNEETNTDKNETNTEVDNENNEKIKETTNATTLSLITLEDKTILDEEKKETQEKEPEKETKKEKTQIEKDTEEIKKRVSFIKPISGVISSGFGEREETSIITKEHNGIDIAAKEGTKIKAAMSGKVIVASYNKEYGNFIKIEDNDVMTVYAHCKKLKVKEGKKVKKGDVIGLVGSTRKFYWTTFTF